MIPGWGSVAQAMASAIEGQKAHRKAAELAMETMRRMYEIDDPQVLLYSAGRAQQLPSKCPSCGSREFRQHAGRSVCSYCRSES